ncbi:MAG: Rpn family recombination-promoting nuclease/putative transposase, partial [Lachnospiraceae bacterium]|nr:Rpn family recombination-promoting nuclease/putative transposase [Lachnospiraceae bacterium]
EHKANIDYNVVMKILRHMVFIWEDYEKEMDKKQPGLSKTKGFQYPPVLPIIFYDGKDSWSAATHLKDRIFLSDVLTEYIPDFNCILVQLKNYSNTELMKRKDELSIIMMIEKLQKASDFSVLGTDVSPQYLQDVTSESPAYLLDIMAQIIEILLLRLNVPSEEASDFAGQVKERHMGELFTHFETYDVQATRREEREKTTEKGSEKLLNTSKDLTHSKETAVVQLMKQYELTESEALEKIKLYW